MTAVSERGSLLRFTLEDGMGLVIGSIGVLGETEWAIHYLVGLLPRLEEASVGGTCVDRSSIAVLISSNFT